MVYDGLRLHWEFQDPKMEVYCIIEGHILQGIPLHRPYIGLHIVGTLQFGILKWPLITAIDRYQYQ